MTNQRSFSKTAEIKQKQKFHTNQQNRRALQAKCTNEKKKEKQTQKWEKKKGEFIFFIYVLIIPFPATTEIRHSNNTYVRNAEKYNIASRERVEQKWRKSRRPDKEALKPTSSKINDVKFNTSKKNVKVTVSKSIDKKFVHKVRENPVDKIATSHVF